MNKNRPIFSKGKPRFSRATLNFIIITVALLIIFLSQSEKYLQDAQSPAAVANPPEPPPTITPNDATEQHTNTPQNTPIQPASETLPTQTDATEKTTLTSLEKVPLKVTTHFKMRSTSWQTEKGAKVLFMPAHELPMIDIRLTFAAGSSQEAPEKAGMATLTATLLFEGTDTLNVDDIAAHFESLGATYSASAYRDMAVVNLRSLTDPEYLEPALAMFSTVIGAPSYPEEAVTRDITRLKIGLEHEKQSPSSLISKAFIAHLYENHPYGHHSRGTEQSLNTLSRQDLIDYHKKYYVAKNSTMTIVGDIKEAQAKEIAEKIISSLQAGEKAAPTPPANTDTPSIQDHIVFNSQQTHIMLGLPAINATSPLHADLYLANEIFGGGGFSSILMTEVREKRGLSYSTSSKFRRMRAEGPFIISLQTKNESAKEALNVVYQELENFAKNGPTEEQLEHARNNLLASFPLQFASNQGTVSQLNSIGFYDLPLNYLESFYKGVQNATTASVHEAFKKTIKPEFLYTLTLGPTAVVEQAAQPSAEKSGIHTDEDADKKDTQHTGNPLESSPSN